MATVAVFVALGGSSYAALKVGSKQIADNSIRSKDLRNNEVSSSDVKNGSLQPRDFKFFKLPPGPPGPQGLPGPMGPAGANGAPGSALAFARVEDDELDAANSKNVRIAAISPGRYCLIVPAGSKNIIGQLDLYRGSGSIAASLRPSTVSLWCGSAPGSNAVVITHDEGGSIFSRTSKPFMVLVN